MAILAVDFDGTLQLKDGAANIPLISRLNVCQRHGDTVILWTCRSGKRLAEAVQFCATNGLHPNYVNDNAPQVVRRLGANPRKIYADMYIDDKGWCP